MIKRPLKTSAYIAIGATLITLGLTACVVEPYDAGPPPGPSYGYYGYGPVYPWGGVSVDLANGYGHGGYYRGGYGRGWGGYHGGGFRH